MATGRAALRATSTAVQRGRHVPPAVRQRELLDLAEALFVERGFQGASMDELARRAGISKPVVYDTVGSKEQLFGLCIDRAADELEASVAQAVAGQVGIEAQLRAGGLAFFRFVADRRPVWDVLLSGNAAAFVTAVDQMRARQARLVTDMLAAGATPGTPAVEIEAIAHLLNGAYESLASWWATHPELAPEQLMDWMAAVVVPGLDRLAQVESGR